jgi:hypothetical protein
MAKSEKNLDWSFFLDYNDRKNALKQNKNLLAEMAAGIFQN